LESSVKNISRQLSTAALKSVTTKVTSATSRLSQLNTSLLAFQTATTRSLAALNATLTASKAEGGPASGGGGLTPRVSSAGGIEERLSLVEAGLSNLAGLLADQGDQLRPLLAAQNGYKGDPVGGHVTTTGKSTSSQKYTRTATSAAIIDHVALQNSVKLTSSRQSSWRPATTTEDPQTTTETEDTSAAATEAQENYDENEE
jgi:hypothetical protein